MFRFGIQEFNSSDETDHFHLLLSLQQAWNNFFQLPKFRLHSSAHFEIELLLSLSGAPQLYDTSKL